MIIFFNNRYNSNKGKGAYLPERGKSKLLLSEKEQREFYLSFFLDESIKE
jgi:hypothetical protein